MKTPLKYLDSTLGMDVKNKDNGKIYYNLTVKIFKGPKNAIVLKPISNSQGLVSTKIKQISANEYKNAPIDEKNFSLWAIKKCKLSKIN